MIASLPMYDRPANAAAYDRLYHLIRDSLRDFGEVMPAELDRATPYYTGWQRPDLALGQICILPLRTRFANTFTLIGQADHALGGCPPGTYRSYIIVRRDDPRAAPREFLTARFACNALHSLSGFTAAQEWAGNILPAPVITGSHDASVAMILAGQADIAAIDAQTWWMQARESRDHDGLRIIGQSSPAPGQSYVSRTITDPHRAFDAIAQAIAALSGRDRETLNLRGITRPTETTSWMDHANITA